LAVLQSLAADRVLDPNHDVQYVGREGSIEQRVAAEENIPFAPLQVRGFRSLAPWSLISSMWLLLGAQSQCRRIFNNFKPQAVLATGGYVSAAAIWIARQTQVPVVIYLPDLEPGWAIRALSRWAETVAVSFDEVISFFPSGKGVVTGYPVRAAFYHTSKADGRTHFGLAPLEPVITAFGGSQGAHSINEAVRENLNALLEIGHVLHISGREDEPMLRGHRAGLSNDKNMRYHLFGYLDQEMPMALAAADLVVARAGAATLGEFPAVGVASILVPYPFAGRHQEKNADYLVSRGAGVKLEDEELAKGLTPVVKDLLSDRDRLGKMASAAHALAQPDAAKNIANLLIKVMR
jgi:UDP-N-acetylglucosamine--N-acetylmuramyl-(pentapeptide) pyrophosphoryl-undecaprenol N-acetylglucosamine transferase